MSDRSVVSLNGAWHIIVDPYENGYYDYRLQPTSDGYFRNAKPRTKSDRIEYDFSRSPTLEVPGDWNSQRPELFLYEGTIWYQRTFEQRLAPGTRVFLEFGAAAQRATVWLNGALLGHHEGAFTPFSFEVTGALLQGTNDLVVKVDNTRRREAIPTVNTDWWNYGGLTRDVRLHICPQTRIADVFLQLGRGSRSTFLGHVKLEGPDAAGQNLQLEIQELGISQHLETDASGTAVLSFEAAPSLWSPDSPKLYEVTVTSARDLFRDRIGFRSLEARSGEIFLNGEPLFLRGISLHEEAPGGGRRAHSAEHAENLLARAKELGCNFVRLAHYPHNEHMVRAADRLGLLVWSEIPVYWTIDWENANTLENARQQLRENVLRDRNRAAVALWSVANETPVSEARTLFLGTLIADVRALDPTRLITAALEHRYVNETTVLIDDPLGADLDVLGCNEYIGWYDGLPEKCDRITWQSAYDKPLVISELGADALSGFHADPLTRFSEEFQESFYQRQIEMLRRIPFLRGLSPWILVDFRSPRRPLPGIQDMWNRKGLLAPDGTKKKAFFVLQQFYRELSQAGVGTLGLRS
jgi:beta-glucuronidase